jgi:hypothetical protein
MCFFCEHAVDIFIKRELNKDWNDEETRDDLFYMEQEKVLFVDRGGDNEAVCAESENMKNGGGKIGVAV